MKKPLLLALACGILVITAFSFYPSLSNGFTNLDDQVLVYNNPRIMTLSAGNVAGYFTSFHYGLYHPLVLLSFAIEYRLLGGDPVIYHATNLYLHLLNCLLVFWLFCRLMRNPFGAFIVSVLFAIHPLHVESVAWISERKDVLYAFFFLAALIARLYYVDGSGRRYYWLSLALFLLSLLSKPMAVTFPLVLVLFDVMRGRTLADTWAEKAPFFFLAAVFSAVTFIGQHARPGAAGFSSFSVFQNVLAAHYNLLFYLHKTLWPADLSCLYPSPVSRSVLVAPTLRYSPLIVSLLALAVIASLRYTRKAAYGALFFLITILPVIQAMPVGLGVPADRYTYLPLLGVFYIFAEGFSRLLSSARMPVRVMLLVPLAAAVASLSVLTRDRCRVWRDSVTLYDDVLARYPDSAIARNNRGQAWSERGNDAQALADYNAALALDPAYRDAYNNRGIVYLHNGDFCRAFADFRRAIEINPRDRSAYINCGNVFMQQGEYSRAAAWYTRALSVDPRSELAYFNRGNAYLAEGDNAAALAEYGRALEINPQYEGAYNNRGIAYIRKKEYARAVADFTRIVRINPRSPEAYFNRGSVLLETGRYQDALSDFNRALAISPGDARAYFNRANVYGILGDYRRAADEYSRAIEIRPGYAEAYRSRAMAFWGMGDYANAWVDARKAKSLGCDVDPSFIASLRERVRHRKTGGDKKMTAPAGVQGIP